MRGRKKRSGAALLEAIAALAILSIAGITTLLLMRESSRAVASSRVSESQMSRATAFLDAVALWPADELDRSLGARMLDEWRLLVDRAGSVYTVSLADTASGRVLLTTGLYRGRSLQDAP